MPIESVKEVVGRIKRRFSIERVILVCDRGMVSRENIDLLEREKFGYILGVRLRKVKKDTLELDMRKVEAESRFDGKFVLTTNTEIEAGEAAVTYKNLLLVEQAFRGLKDILATKPVYHRTSDNTKGHVFCSYLALLLIIELRRKLKVEDDVPPWPEVIRDLRSLQAIKLEVDGKTFLLRSDFEGVAHRCFMAAGVKPPPVITQM